MRLRKSINRFEKDESETSFVDAAFEFGEKGMHRKADAWAGIGCGHVQVHRFY